MSIPVYHLYSSCYSVLYDQLIDHKLFNTAVSAERMVTFIELERNGN